ncbi:MAG: hypothetical protein JW969_19045 [Spirochaetales bacterium]|nr:hypothetical protein [Spirochaetales bacterium]
MSKPKVAVSWNSSCGGCDESIVDLEEKILDVAEAVEFVLWPCAMDFKYEQIEALPDEDITVSLINGAIQNTDQEHVVKLLRRKSKIVIAFGSCACYGGVPSLLNLKNLDDSFRVSYTNSPTVINEQGTVPSADSEDDGHALSLPSVYKSVRKLDDVIDVDYFLPGCPPTASMIASALTALLEGKLPERKSVLASNKSLCSSCSRNDSKPETVSIKNLVRIHEVKADPGLCFLAQGIICMGPATRDGCDYPCIKGNMPCTGCLGPFDRTDQGAKMTGTLGGLLEAGDEEAAKKMADGIVDPAGTFYRYSVAASLLGGKREGEENE